MPNVQQLALLSLGVERWNKWRLVSAEIPDLSGADLSGANLTGADLSGCNLEEANLTSAILCWA
ncbi:MAG: pentapeptide repeat-containing protein, partial [Acidobacteriota bacterium]|nr:pentapeptide repeat-containing protein [Acidobacteriota bacterium]